MIVRRSQPATLRCMVKSENYLRARRRQWQLTQRELAFLFGYTDCSIVSRLERHERTITPAVVHACQLLFDCEPTDIFPALFEQAEAGLVSRIHELHARLAQGARTTRTAAKLRLLEEALARLTAQYQEV